MAWIGSILGWILWLYSLVLIARMILSWVPMFSPDWRPRGPVLVVAEAIYTVTDPPLRFLRRFIPSVRFGNVAIDLSFLVLWLIVIILQRVVYSVF